MGAASPEYSLEKMKKKPKSIQEILVEFLKKEGIKGFIKLMEKDPPPHDPFFEMLCEHSHDDHP